VTSTNEDTNIRLTEWTSCGGCAAKWGGSPLRALIGELSSEGIPGNLLVGLAPFDDAAVFRITDDVALVSTTDFFPPLVDDPADFGAIAAANACSDVFAMGGRVIMALNIAAFPENFPSTAMEQIFMAASEVVLEAGGVIAGGHTIRSEEPIFGLAVQGIVHPEHIFIKGGARVGDVLVLSKPLGTGIVLASGSDDEKQFAIAGMRLLNKQASLDLQALGSVVHAVTDVTGYGLFGHGFEMAEGSAAVLVFEAASLPFYPGAVQLAQAGTRTGGDARNRQYLAGRIDVHADEAIEALCFDPQTSGGLLASVDPSAIASLDARRFTVIGSVEAGQARVVLRP
jgi:selenide, water dikinase